MYAHALLRAHLTQADYYRYLAEFAKNDVKMGHAGNAEESYNCLLYTSPSPRDS